MDSNIEKDLEVVQQGIKECEELINDYNDLIIDITDPVLKLYYTNQLEIMKTRLDIQKKFYEVVKGLNDRRG